MTGKYTLFENLPNGRHFKVSQKTIRKHEIPLKPKERYQKPLSVCVATSAILVDGTSSDDVTNPGNVVVDKHGEIIRLPITNFCVIPS